MSRTGNPLDSKVLMDTQDSLTNSVVFFLSRSKKRKLCWQKFIFKFFISFWVYRNFCIVYRLRPVAVNVHKQPNRVTNCLKINRIKLFIVKVILWIYPGCFYMNVCLTSMQPNAWIIRNFSSNTETFWIISYLFLGRCI